MIHHSLSEIVREARTRKKRGYGMCKYILHQILQECIGGIYEILCKVRICHPRIMVYIDGGICSQMRQFVLGQIFINQGIDVVYDLSWYERDGMDVDKKFPRLYELEQMFPDLRVQKSSPWTTQFYRMFLCYSSRTEDLPAYDAKQIAPIYLGGYYTPRYEVWYTALRNSLLSYKTSEVSLPKYFEYNDKITCAIHVRRGDLANGDNPWYGGVSDDYFIKAIDYVCNHFQNVLFLFFSDEIDYVKSKIAPRLTVNYKIMETPRKAYEDLILISKCPIIIASQGSFGKMAALMNPDSLLIVQDDKFAKEYIDNRSNTIAL